jgi:sarcosine oxidase subunit delta
MRINCPYCGARDHSEFSYEGDATLKRPENDDTDAWRDYVYHRTNPKGRHKELWSHVAGCRAWVVVERNTLTHEIYESYLPEELNND